MILLALAAHQCGFGQGFTQRGFLDLRPAFYPDTAPNDASHTIGEALFRYSASWEARSWLKLNGEVEARSDTHRQSERTWHLDTQDRGLLRPAFSIRRGSATLHGGGWTIELGKQFVRWGKTDILNPTDRFAPRDYLAVFDNDDFLGVTGARATWEHGGDTLDAVVTRFTPSRTPLLNQRWTVLPDNAPPVVDLGSRFPGGAQAGVRWNHLGQGYEASLSFFDGHNHLPLIDAFAIARKGSGLAAGLQRYYARMRMYGGDAAIPLRWLTLKTEAAYFTSATRIADEYVLYVVQLERQAGEWFFTGGYAGQAVTNRRSIFDFAPDRGLTRAFVAHAGYTIDPSSNVAVESAIRQNGKGGWAKLEYSRLFGQHLRVTATAAVIQGDGADFIGQYHRNSYGGLALRYSF